MSRSKVRWLVLVACVGLVAVTVGPGASAGGQFVDDDGNVHEANIDAIAAAGITFGCNTDGTQYCPAELVTRAQMASFLARAFSLEAADQDYFVDDDGNVHEDNINRIRAAGVTLGCDTDGTRFCPDDPTTRAQMASFLARAADLEAADQDYFVDDATSGHEDNINRIAYQGITVGCHEFHYCPTDHVPRDQMASFIARALGIGEVQGTGTLVIRVVEESTGNPITDAPPVPAPHPWDREVTYGTAVFGDPGVYTLDGISAGLWVVAAGNGTEGHVSPWAREYFDGKPDRDSADRVLVTSIKPTEVTIQLSMGGTISGTVTDETTGLPIEGVEVQYLILEAGGLHNGFGGDVTASDGTYMIEGLATGLHKVCFFDERYQAECWDDVKHNGEEVPLTPGDFIEVTVGEAVTGIDAALTP